MTALVVMILALSLSGITVPAAAATPPTPLKIALIGDSYSSGNGADSYALPDGCYRSSNNWAARYTSWLNTQGYAASMVNRACSGGVIDTFSSPRTLDAFSHLGVNCPQGAPDETVSKVGGVPPFITCQGTLAAQMNSLGKDTDLVLLTFGGDDIHFVDIVKECFIVGLRDPGSCRTKVNDANAGLSTVQSNLTSIFATMRQRLRPDAKVVLLGYPQLIGDIGYVLKSHNLLHQVTDTYDAATGVRALGTTGHVAQDAAVEAANTAAGADFVTYVDNVIPYFAGHEPDPRPGESNTAAWLNEKAASWDRNEWYHPNNAGHNAYADLLKTHGSFGAGGGSAATSGSLDLAFVIDTTGSMAGTIGAVKDQVQAVADQLAAGTSSYRIAVTSFRDQPAYTGDPGDYASRVDQPFTTDTVAVKSAVSGLAAAGGGDTPESAYSGIEAALSLPWRPGVKKQIIVFTDAPAHDPEPVSGLTATDIINHARAIDPAVANVIDSGGASSLSTVSEGTGGTLIAASDPVAVGDAITKVIDTSLKAPFAWIGESYFGAVGTPVTFDAGGSFDPGGGTLSYDWDVDDDGTVDRTTTGPTLSWTYPAVYEGLVSMTVRSSSGLSGTATAPVTIDEDGDGFAAAVDNCPSIANVDQLDTDGDGTGDACDSTPGLPTEDAEGITIEATVNSVPVTTPDEFTTPTGQVLTIPTPGVLAGDYDPDPADTLSAKILTGPAHGRTALTADGSFTYTADPAYVGDDTFTYAAVDNHGAASPTTTVTVHVTEPQATGQRVAFVATGANGMALSGKLTTGSYVWASKPGRVSTVKGTGTIKDRRGTWNLAIDATTTAGRTRGTVTVTGPKGYHVTFTGPGLVAEVRSLLLGVFKDDASAKQHRSSHDRFAFVIWPPTKK